MGKNHAGFNTPMGSLHCFVRIDRFSGLKHLAVSDRTESFDGAGHCDVDVCNDRGKLEVVASFGICGDHFSSDGNFENFGAASALR
jgi:hypothetical protein